MIAQIPLHGKGSAELNGPAAVPGRLPARRPGVPQDRPAGQPGQRDAQHHRPRHRREVARHRRRRTSGTPTSPPTDSTSDSLKQVPAGADTLALELVSTGFALELSHADVPAVVPGLLAGPVPPGGTAQGFDAVGINGAPLTAAAQQTVQTLPVLGSRASSSTTRHWRASAVGCPTAAPCRSGSPTPPRPTPWPRPERAGGRASSPGTAWPRRRTGSTSRRPPGVCAWPPSPGRWACCSPRWSSWS